MRFAAFYSRLAEKPPQTFVEVDLLAEIVNECHAGVGKVSFSYFPNFPGAQWGSFIWLEEQRSSPYEEAFHDAMIFINSEFVNDVPMRRIVAAKELMHVFDDSDRRAGTPETFRRLVSDIANNPLLEDASEPYKADRAALWKAMVSLVPPWIRVQAEGSTESPEFWAARWQVPLPTIDAVMGEYYPHMVSRFTGSD